MEFADRNPRLTPACCAACTLSYICADQYSSWFGER